MLRITTASAPTVRLRCTRPNQQQRSVDPNVGTIERRALLGGLIHEYHQAAA
jgi:hypothetical protein